MQANNLKTSAECRPNAEECSLLFFQKVPREVLMVIADFTVQLCKLMP